MLKPGQEHAGESEQEEEAGLEDEDLDDEEIDVSDTEDGGSESQDSKAESSDMVPVGDKDSNRASGESTMAEPLGTVTNDPCDDGNPSDDHEHTIQEEKVLERVQKEESKPDPTPMSDRIEDLQKKIWQAKKELTAKNFG